MGMFDVVLVPCPECGKKHEAQSKGGECCLGVYNLSDAPQEVLQDVNRHAPFQCDGCGNYFIVKICGNPVNTSQGERCEQKRD